MLGVLLKRDGVAMRRKVVGSSCVKEES